MRRILLFVALLFLCVNASAQLTPDRYSLNLKGVLTDNAGNPRPNGTYSVQFRLYAAASGPDAPLFSETKNNVVVFTTPALVAGQPDRRGKYGSSTNPVTLGINSTPPPRQSVCQSNAVAGSCCQRLLRAPQADSANPC